MCQRLAIRHLWAVLCVGGALAWSVFLVIALYLPLFEIGKAIR